MDVQPEPAWLPQPGPQMAAVTCPIEDLFYGGQRGGGKTDFLLGDFATHAAEYGEDAHGILFRRTYDELDEVIKRSRIIYTRLGWTYHEQKKTWTAPNHATLKFRFLDRDADASRYQGHQYTWMGFDEVGVWPSPEPLDELWACLRSAAGIPCVRRLTGNPGGVGHHWLKARYVTPSLPLQQYRWPPQPDSHPDLWISSIFIPAKLEDNQILLRNDPEYEKRIAAATKGNKALWRAWRFGDWDVVAGAAFEEWRQDHHVQKYEVPAGWSWFAGADYGFTKPCAIVILAAGPKGDIYARDELYLTKKTPYDAGYLFGQKIKRFPQLEFVCLDYPFSNDGGPSIIEEMQRGLWDADPARKVAIVSAKKHKGSRAIRKQLLHEALGYEALPDGTIPTWSGAKLRFHPDCKNTVRTIPALPLDPSSTEDIDTDAEDHAYDALTNALYARVPVPLEREHKSVPVGKHTGWDLQNRRRKPRYVEALDEAEALEQHHNQLGPGGFFTGYRYGGARPEADA